MPGSVALPAPTMQPYRSHSEPPEAPLPQRERAWDLIFVLGILLVASLARVVGAVVRGETFGADASLALLVVLASAAWAVKSLARLVLGRNAGPQAPEG